MKRCGQHCRLAERQTRSGGLNGRPEKLQDVCYSWWCLSALAILGRLHWIDRDALSAFILQCQARPVTGSRRSPALHHALRELAAVCACPSGSLLTCTACQPSWSSPHRCRMQRMLMDG